MRRIRIHVATLHHGSGSCRKKVRSFEEQGDDVCQSGTNMHVCTSISESRKVLAAVPSSSINIADELKLSSSSSFNSCHQRYCMCTNTVLRIPLLHQHHRYATNAANLTAQSYQNTPPHALPTPYHQWTFAGKKPYLNPVWKAPKAPPCPNAFPPCPGPGVVVECNPA